MEQVEVDGVVYDKFTDENGRDSLRRFNSRYNMWVTLNFSGIENREAEDLIIGTLSHAYIEKAT
jgi:hypothetical protein